MRSRAARGWVDVTQRGVRRDAPVCAPYQAQMFLSCSLRAWSAPGAVDDMGSTAASCSPCCQNAVSSNQSVSVNLSATNFSPAAHAFREQENVEDSGSCQRGSCVEDVGSGKRWDCQTLDTKPLTNDSVSLTPEHTALVTPSLRSRPWEIFPGASKEVTCLRRPS